MRRLAVVTLQLAVTCLVSIVVGAAAYVVFSGRGGARATAEEFLNALRLGDAGAMLRVSTVDSDMEGYVGELLDRLPRLSSYSIGAETQHQNLSRIAVELVGPAAGRPIAGVGRQRLNVTLTLRRRGGDWRVDARRFFQDAYAGALPNGADEYRTIVGGGDESSASDSR